MRIFIIIILLFFGTKVLGQTPTESDIKILAEQINQKIKGADLGDGVKARGCIAIGRTLIYQYDVDDYWEASINIRELLISNFKTAGLAKYYFLDDINVDFYYYKGNTLIKKVSLKSNEFSTYKFELGKYISINNHKKSKGVNLKLTPPKGWEIKEGNRPNIVKKFTKNGITYLILIKENMTFFSRSKNREILNEESFVNELLEETSSLFKNPEIIEKSVVSIDNYPSLTFKIKGIMESSGMSFPMIMKAWIVYYEDKIIFLQAAGKDNAEFKSLEKLFLLITNSVIFPEQYN